MKAYFPHTKYPDVCLVIDYDKEDYEKARLGAEIRPNFLNNMDFIEPHLRPIEWWVRFNNENLDNT